MKMKDEREVRGALEEARWVYFSSGIYAAATVEVAAQLSVMKRNTLEIITNTRRV